MKALFLDIQPPLESKLLDPRSTQNLGVGALSLSKKLDRPLREFSAKTWEKLLRDQIQILRNEIHAGRVTGVFFTDGDQYGDIVEPIFISDGNGSQTQFLMPFPYVHAPSWKIWDNQTLKTDWVMDEEVGSITFTAAPVGRITGIGKRKFKVVIIDNSESLLNESQIYKNNSGEGVYEHTAIVLREVFGVNVV